MKKRDGNTIFSTFVCQKSYQSRIERGVKQFIPLIIAFTIDEIIKLRERRAPALAAKGDSNTRRIYGLSLSIPTRDVSDGEREVLRLQYIGARLCATGRN